MIPIHQLGPERKCAERVLPGRLLEKIDFVDSKCRRCRRCQRAARQRYEAKRRSQG